jgi:C4-dicarboxylate-binding protein DctP
MTDPSAALARRYYEVQKYGTVVANHLAAYGIVYANPAWVSKLPADMQAALKRASQKVEIAGVKQGTQGVEEAIKGLREKGMVITVLTEAQASVWAKTMQDPAKAVFIERAGEAGKTVLQGF